MKSQVVSILCSVLLMLSILESARAADESFADSFVGSPLLILAAIVAIDLLAFVYHKIRK